MGHRHLGGRVPMADEAAHPWRRLYGDHYNANEVTCAHFMSWACELRTDKAFDGSCRGAAMHIFRRVKHIIAGDERRNNVYILCFFDKHAASIEKRR